MARTLEVRIVLRANQFKSGLTNSASQLQKYGVQVSQTMTQTAQASKALGIASAAAGKLVVLGIGGAMVVSAKAAIDFESSLASVAKTTNLAGEAFDDTASPLNTFGKALRNLALRVPINVNDLAEIAALGGQLGIETPNLIEFTETIAQLGVSTNLSTQEAATGLARFVNIMGTSQDDFDRLGSILVELGNNFATTEAEILNFGLRIAPVAKAVGATEDEVFALSAAMTSLGIPAERGGTAIQRLFTQMAQAVDAGGKKLELFGQVAGMTADQFGKLFQESPARAFAAFVKGLDRINESGQSIFGTLKDLDIQEQRTIQVLLASASGWETVASAIDTAAAESEEANALAEESARRFGTTASQLQLLGNAFNDLRIEIGGMILGSGGLTSAINVMKEFFGILKDNLETLKNFALILGGIAITRLLLGFSSLIPKLGIARQEFKGLATNATGASFAMKGVNIASAAMNLALGAVSLVMGIVIGQWVAAAIKAAELKAEVERLNEAFANGEDPVTAFVDVLTDNNLLTEDLSKLLSDLGVSERDFAEAMLAGRDASDLFTGSMKDQFEEAQRLFNLGYTSDATKTATLTDQQRDLIRIIELAEEARLRVEAVTGSRKNDLVQVLQDATVAAGYTADEINSVVDQAVRLFGLDITDAELMAFFNQWRGEGSTGKDVRDFWRNNTRELITGKETFMQAISAAGGDAGDVMDDFTKTLLEGTEDFHEKLDEIWKDIHDSIVEGMPTEAEYEQIATLTEDGLNKILAAQDLYILDVQSWTMALGEIRGTVSADTLAWLEGQTPQFKGALGRLMRENRPAFDAWVADLDSNFDELAEENKKRFDQVFPEAAAESFTEMAATLTGLVAAHAEEFSLTGEQTAEEIMTGLQTQLSGMSTEEQDKYIGYLKEVFNDPEKLRMLGFNAGDPVVQGWLAAIGTLAERSEPILNNEAASFSRMMKGKFMVQSPSKMTYEIGWQVGEGLFQGMKDNLAGLDPIRMMATPSRAEQIPPVRIINEGGGGYSKSMNVTINHPQTGNLREDVQLMTIWNGLTESVEGVRV